MVSQIIGSNRSTSGDLTCSIISAVSRDQTSSTDRRDMVYGLLSLIAPEEAQIIGSDDDIAISQVYAKATYASSLVRKTLDILFGKPLHSQSSVTGLPTWAFDSTLPPRLINVPRTIGYSMESPGLCRSSVKLDADMLTFRITGQRFDAIKESMELDADDRWMKSRVCSCILQGPSRFGHGRRKSTFGKQPHTENRHTA